MYHPHSLEPLGTDLLLEYYPKYVKNLSHRFYT